MSNSEILEQNNSKIEELIELVKKKAAGEEVEEVYYAEATINSSEDGVFTLIDSTIDYTVLDTGIKGNVYKTGIIRLADGVGYTYLTLQRDMSILEPIGINMYTFIGKAILTDINMNQTFYNASVIVNIDGTTQLGLQPENGVYNAEVTLINTNGAFSIDTHTINYEALDRGIIEHQYQTAYLKVLIDSSYSIIPLSIANNTNNDVVDFASYLFKGTIVNNDVEYDCVITVTSSDVNLQVTEKSSGGEKLYRHVINIYTSANIGVGSTQILSKSNEIFTRTKITEFLISIGCVSSSIAYPLSGGYTSTNAGLAQSMGMYVRDGSLVVKTNKNVFKATQAEDGTMTVTPSSTTNYISISGGTDYCTDTVSEV